MRRRTSGSHHSRSVPPGPQLTTNEQVTALERDQSLFDDGERQPDPRGDLCREKRPERPRVPQEHPLERIVDRLEERLGQPTGWHEPHRVPVETRVLRGDQRSLTSETEPKGTPLTDERLHEPRIELSLAEVADGSQQVVELVGITRHAPE